MAAVPELRAPVFGPCCPADSGVVAEVAVAEVAVAEVVVMACLAVLCAQSPLPAFWYSPAMRAYQHGLIGGATMPPNKPRYDNLN